MRESPTGSLCTEQPKHAERSFPRPTGGFSVQGALSPWQRPHEVLTDAHASFPRQACDLSFYWGAGLRVPHSAAIGQEVTWVLQKEGFVFRGGGEQAELVLLQCLYIIAALVSLSLSLSLCGMRTALAGEQRFGRYSGIEIFSHSVLAWLLRFRQSAFGINLKQSFI